jgi:cystathionine gamma-synthase
MAAIAAVLDLVPAGGRIVAPADCYFGVGELLADARQQGRWAVDRVDLTDTAAVQAAVAGADLLWLETPSNPLLEVADLPALCAAGRRAGAITGVDNTFATPLLQQPLAFGADVVVHSATKFIGGHSDLLSGITIARDQALDHLHVIVHATSLGGVESTIERRGKLAGQGHMPPGLLRLSVGCEHVDDLWDDLNSALQQASRPGNPA